MLQTTHRDIQQVCCLHIRTPQHTIRCTSKSVCRGALEPSSQHSSIERRLYRYISRYIPDHSKAAWCVGHPFDGPCYGDGSTAVTTWSNHDSILQNHRDRLKGARTNESMRRTGFYAVGIPLGHLVRESLERLLPGFRSPLLHCQGARLEQYLLYIEIETQIQV
jgi:hypothetical protein